VLLLFRRGASLETVKMPGGTIPPHDGSGPLHVAFGMPREQLAGWEARLRAHDIAIEGRTDWPRGGHSIYFRDPDGHLVELATPGLGEIYLALHLAPAPRNTGPVGPLVRKAAPRHGRSLAPDVHHQFRAPASGGPWRAAPRARARRRGGRARRSAYRAPASRHREADRVQDLSAGAALFRSARLRRPDEPGACVQPTDGAAARPPNAPAPPP